MTEDLRALQDCLSAEASMHGSVVPLEPIMEPVNAFAEKIMSLVDARNAVHAIMSLDALQDYTNSSILTPIDAHRTNAVFGEGNPQADIMLIGEAPGAEEDRTGKPFVGRAGQLLDKMLGAIQLSRVDIFIGNILKTRPPQNRDPQPDEIASHLPVLYRQMSLIQPRFILCLGRIAGQTLLNTTAPLGKLRGQAQPYHGATLIVTYHPAALLRSPKWKRPAWEDLKLLRRLATQPV